MAQYAINQDIDNARNPRRVLIGTPLILALLFSFGFMTMRPASSDTAIQSAVSHPAAAKTDSTALTSGDFAPIALAETSLPTLSEAPVAATMTASSATTTPTSPQAASKAASPAGSTSPQSATASGQSVNPNHPLRIKVNLPNSLLTNFLR